MPVVENSLSGDHGSRIIAGNNTEVLVFTALRYVRIYHAGLQSSRPHDNSVRLGTAADDVPFIICEEGCPVKSVDGLCLVARPLPIAGHTGGTK